MLLGTAVFIEGPMIVRFIHYSGGTLEDVARHMSHQPAVHNFEEALQPYLAEERDTTTPEAFREFFTKSTMRCLTQASGELESRGGGRAARIGVGPLAKPASPEGSVRSPGRSTDARSWRSGRSTGRPVSFAPWRIRRGNSSN